MYPSLSQFTRWASRYRAVPLWVEPHLPANSLVEWVRELNTGKSNFFFLHSSGSGTQARYSYFALEEPHFIVRASGGTLVIEHLSEAAGTAVSAKVGNPFDRFHEWLGHCSGPRVDGLPPFWGGAVGYFGHESARYFDPRLKRLFSRRQPAGASDDPATWDYPDFEFGIYDLIGAVDHARQKLWLIHTVFLPERKQLSPAQLERIYRNAQDRLLRQAVRVQRAVREDRPWKVFTAPIPRSNRSEHAYQSAVRRAKTHMAAGEIYQINLSQSFSADWNGDPWSLYRQLSAANPSPYGALWRSGTRWIASASPELLLRQEDNRLEARPMAGTHPRGSNPDSARRMCAALLNDCRKRAGHIMLVDAARGDLSRVCAPSSLNIAELAAVEAHSRDFYLVSDIRGTLFPGKTWRDSVKAVFPAGTVTGCPKIRSIEIIRKLESLPRGPYGGSLGWIGFNGDLTLNVLTRTFFMDRQHLRFPVGAGIVADSILNREYEETWHKAEAMMDALDKHVPLYLFPMEDL
jgi:anthranilate/para-aminobenzoate synthase component I